MRFTNGVLLTVDWDELPAYLRAGIDAHFVKHYSEVFDIVFDTKNNDPVAALREKIAADKEKEKEKEKQQAQEHEGHAEEKPHRERRSQVIVNAKARMEPVD